LKRGNKKKQFLNLGRWYDILSSLYAYIPYYLFPSRALPPLHLFVELTYRCNLRCAMCQFLPLLEGGELDRKRTEELSKEEILAFVGAFPRTSVVTLTGGEPFLRKDFPQIIGALAGRNKIHIITNGTLLTEKNVNLLWEHRLRRIWGGGLLALGISIQGPAEVHDAIVGRRGAFETACAGIRMLNDLKEREHTPFPHIHTTAVITDRNAGHLADIYGISRDLKAEYCNFTLFNSSDFGNRLNLENITDYETGPPFTMPIDAGILKRQFDLMEQTAEKSVTQIRFSPFGISREEVMEYYSGRLDVSRFYCNSPWRMLGISAYGDVSSCPLLSIGNIRKEDISRLWNSRNQARFRKALKKRGIFPVCLGCCQGIYAGEKGVVSNYPVPRGR
jgi:radical SAM protein with 4Fe4S-binding SPASM domain